MIDLALLGSEWVIQRNAGRLASPLVQDMLPANPRRFAVIFTYFAPGGGVNPDDEIVNLWPGDSKLVASFFLSQYRNLTLNFKDYGGLVQQEWWASTAKGIGGNVFSIEVIQTARQEGLITSKG